MIYEKNMNSRSYDKNVRYSQAVLFPKSRRILYDVSSWNGA